MAKKAWEEKPQDRKASAKTPKQEIAYTEVYNAVTDDKRAAAAAVAAGAAATPGVVRTPKLIAAEIRQIRAATERMVLLNAVQVGQRLYEAKAIVGYGQWREWLRVEVDYGKSTVASLMRLYREYGMQQKELSTGGRSPDVQTFGHLTFTQALELLALPESEREKFIEGHDMESLTTREFRALIDEEKQKMQAEVERAEQYLEETQNELEIKEEELEEAQKELEEALKLIEDMEEREARNERLLKGQKSKARKKEDPEKKKKRNLLRDRQSDVLRRKEREFQATVNELKGQIAALQGQMGQGAEALPELEELHAQLRGTVANIYTVNSGLLLEHHSVMRRTILEMRGESKELSHQFKEKYIKRLEAMLADARAIDVGE